jgi:hypothetical protein
MRVTVLAGKWLKELEMDRFSASCGTVSTYGNLTECWQSVYCAECAKAFDCAQVYIPTL